MQFENTKLMPRWVFIANLRTNLCRKSDSDANSNANQTIIHSMYAGGGWSPQMPHAAVSMKTWPFEKSTEVPNGCTAQEQIDEEMAVRLDILNNLKKDEGTDEGRVVLQAFRDLYCDKKGNLHKLTIENAYWTHSGHQRMEFCFTEAYTQYKLVEFKNSVTKVEADKEPLVPFVPEIPTLIGTYVDLRDILEDQLRVNANVGEQNKLTVFDYIKNAVIMIGTTGVLGITEKAFRKLCAAQGLEGKGKGSSGVVSRQAWLIAYLDWLYAGKLELVRRVNEPPKKTSGTETIDNPEYIDIRELHPDHTDPRCNIAVIVRICEKNLDRLRDYVKENGQDNDKVKDGSRADTVSKLEYEIFRRGKDGKGEPWSFDEANAWVTSKRKGLGKAGGYKAPVVTAKPEPFKIEKITGPVQSAYTPACVREQMSELTGIPLAINQGVAQGAIKKNSQLRDQLDFVWELVATDPTDKMILDMLGELKSLKTGNTDAFQALVPQVHQLIKASIPAAV